MSPLLILVTTAALGVEVGWQPLANGGHEYTIQIEPQLLRVLESGKEEIFSEVPPELDIRRYRIKVGSGQLPRDAGPPAAAPVAAQPEASPPPANNDFDSLPRYQERDPGEPPVAAGAQPDLGTRGAPELPPPPANNEPSDWPGPDESASDRSEAGIFDRPREPTDAHVPGKLPPSRASGPIEQAGFDSKSNATHDAAEVQTQRPELPDVPNRPWAVLAGAIVLLCCSLGANAYLGWIAWEARHRYRDTVAKLRTAS